MSEVESAGVRHGMGMYFRALREVVAHIGRERLILSRCDSPEAATAGDALGITMYQGRLIDTRVQEETAKPGAKPAAAARAAAESVPA